MNSNRNVKFVRKQRRFFIYALVLFMIIFNIFFLPSDHTSNLASVNIATSGNQDPDFGIVSSIMNQFYKDDDIETEKDKIIGNSNTNKEEEIVKNKPQDEVIIDSEDEKRRHSMILGCEMEIIASTQPKNRFFVINDYKIKDEDFIKDKRIVEYKSFKSNAKAMKYDFVELPDSKKDRRRILAKDIFKLDDHKRYYDLLQNAICFKPISEVCKLEKYKKFIEDVIQTLNIKKSLFEYGISDKFKKLFQKMVAADPNERFNSIDEILERIELDIQNNIIQNQNN